MSGEGFELKEPEITKHKILKIEDPHFNPENIAIVTGAASGIGQATSISLSHNGITVVGTDIDEEGLNETKQKIEKIGDKENFISKKADITKDEEVKKVVEKADEQGQIKFIANIAGMQHISSLSNFSMEKYDLLQRIMLRGPFLLSKLSIPYIEKTEDGTGAIANMSSVHGHFATKDKPAYITTKFGLRGLTQAIAAEGDGKIRSFSVSVGYVLTPLMINQIEDTAKERGMSKKQVVKDVMLGQARTKKMMTPIEVANLFTFGFSKHGKHLNGGDLLWDGGYTLTYE